jgi:hypothetical protein
MFAPRSETLQAWSSLRVASRTVFYSKSVRPKTWNGLMPGSTGAGIESGLPHA